MKCPKCKPINLSPMKLEGKLPVMGCRSCEGTLISLLHYRDWAERFETSFDIETVELKTVEGKDTKTALVCPKCASLMTKYKITGDNSNRLDLCANCDEAWLDQGEWSLMKSLTLTQDLPDVFTDAWQTRIIEEKTEKQQYQRLVKQVGEADAEKTEEVKTWLKGNKNKFMILHYLGYE